MFKQFEQFRMYLQKNLCPQQLKAGWSLWDNFSAFIAYLVLRGRRYPHKDQKNTERWEKFAKFLFMISMYNEGRWKGKPIPASLLGSYAYTYVKNVTDPMYFLWELNTILSLKAQGIDHPFVLG